MVKAIFFDVDGTLVSFKTHKVSQSTINALNKLREQGVKIFIASGRHKPAINNLGDLQFDAYVTVNGGMSIVGDKLIYKHNIPQNEIQSLINYIDTVEAFPCVFIHENNSLMNYTNHATDEIFKLLDYPCPPMGQLSDVEEDVYQVIAFFNDEQEKQIMKFLPHCETTRWNPLFTDIIPTDSNKWIGISKVLEHFGINKDEAMAFGDGGNDIEMLTNVGLGVAMGNANDDVKSIANYVTTTVDDDGIVNALKHFGLI